MVLQVQLSERYVGDASQPASRSNHIRLRSASSTRGCSLIFNVYSTSALDILSLSDEVTILLCLASIKDQERRLSKLKDLGTLMENLALDPSFEPRCNLVILH